jgi:hypothetical protein
LGVAIVAGLRFLTFLAIVGRRVRVVGTLSEPPLHLGSGWRLGGYVMGNAAAIEQGIGAGLLAHSCFLGPGSIIGMV